MKRPNSNMTINISGYLMSLDIPKVMGILNVTPDSFYAGSRSFSDREIEMKVRQMISEGVDIIDVGACSTRPGFQPPSSDEELERADRACRIVRREAPDIPLSIDTFRSEVASHCIKEYNVNIINDVSCGEDEALWEVAASEKVAYVLTHNKKNSQDYSDVTAEVIMELSQKIDKLHLLGINDIIVDPGFGFAKTLDDNFRLFDSLDEICKIGLPVLVGISRKSMLYKFLEIVPEETLAATVAMDAIALEKGVDILRVHDVKEAKETIRLFAKLKNITQ